MALAEQLGRHLEFVVGKTGLRVVMHLCYDFEGLAGHPDKTVEDLEADGRHSQEQQVGWRT